MKYQSKNAKKIKVLNERIEALEKEMELQHKTKGRGAAYNFQATSKLIQDLKQDLQRL